MGPWDDLDIFVTFHLYPTQKKGPHPQWRQNFQKESWLKVMFYNSISYRLIPCLSLFPFYMSHDEKGSNHYMYRLRFQDTGRKWMKTYLQLLWWLGWTLLGCILVYLYFLPLSWNRRRYVCLVYSKRYSQVRCKEVRVQGRNGEKLMQGYARKEQANYCTIHLPSHTKYFSYANLTFTTE